MATNSDGRVIRHARRYTATGRAQSGRAPIALRAWDGFREQVLLSEAACAALEGYSWSCAAELKRHLARAGLVDFGRGRWHGMPDHARRRMLKWWMDWAHALFGRDALVRLVRHPHRGLGLAYRGTRTVSRDVLRNAVVPDLHCLEDDQVEEFVRKGYSSLYRPSTPLSSLAWARS